VYTARLTSAPGGLKLWLGDLSFTDKSSRDNTLCVFLNLKLGGTAGL